MKNLFLQLLSLFFMITASVQSQDWPNFERFREANKKVGFPAKNENRVVFMGNSITQGWIDYGNPELFSENPFINRGISGQTTPQMLVRFRADVIALQPKAVVILAGINDIAGNTGESTIEMIQDNLISMVQLAQTNNIKVILSSILPANKFTWRPEVYPVDKVIAMNEFIKNYAGENNCLYIDYYTPMVDDEKGLKIEYSEDGVHPNKAGYAVMTPLVLEAIRKALEVKKEY